MDCVLKRISALSISIVVLIYFIFCSTVMITDVSADAVSDMDALTKNYRNFCAVQICTMDGEELYSYNADSPVFCASVIKLPYSVFVCREIEAGKKSLDDTFTYTSSWYHKGTGVIRHNVEGKEYTVRQLLDYMLRYSDNVAWDALCHSEDVISRSVLGKYGTDVAIKYGQVAYKPVRLWNLLIMWVLKVCKIGIPIRISY